MQNSYRLFGILLEKLKCVYHFLQLLVINFTLHGINSITTSRLNFILLK